MKTEGITYVPCSHAVQVAGEVLGSASGGIDQRFFISKVPVLDLALEVDEGTGFQAWTEVEDFAVSEPSDRHYLLNRGTGEVLFGDGLRGKVPAQGTGKVRAGYRYGGGSRGNVGAGTLIRMRQTHLLYHGPRAQAEGLPGHPEASPRGGRAQINRALSS